MHSNVFIFIWRRKLSVLLIVASLILITLWTWALLDTKKYHKPDEFHTSDNSENHQYLIQKLISQANRILRTQRHQIVDDQPNSLSGSKTNSVYISAPAAVHSSRTHKNLGLVRFVRPTKHSSTSFLSVETDQQEQTLALVARRQKLPKKAVGETYLFEEARLKILENQQKARNAGLDEINNIMDYEHIMSSAERQSQYEHELQRMGVPVIAGLGSDSPQIPNERLVHLDLKGAPPKLNFLKQLLPILKSLGATGLLIEYEDMFPYTGVLEHLAAKNAYKVDELKDFLESASAHGLTVMPLIQTFGHMEFALKLQGFDHMREVPESPQSICPSQTDSISFIQNMLTQIIEFHQQHVHNGSSFHGATASEITTKFSHIHIGCDEVYRMGECEKCRQYSRNEIFLSHVITVANFVRTHWPQLKVVIWDDMLRSMTLSEMQNSHIGSYVEPMIWVYINDIYHFIQPQLWDMYSKVFPTAWAASAFKGAFGESLMIPPLQRHLENNIRWLAVIAKEGGRFSQGFKGLALTGWQRYDHFAVLCELLPISVPSLIISLSTVSKGYFNTNPKENDILKVLQCAFHPESRHSNHPWLELHPNTHHSQLFIACTYPGSMAYKFALRLFDKQLEVQNYLTNVQDRSAWMSDYNVRHNFSSPLRVRSLTTNTPILISELASMAKEIHQILYDIFDEHTIGEFVEQNILPMITSLRKQMERAESLSQRRTWPQRPLPNARELVELNLMPDVGFQSNQNI